MNDAWDLDLGASQKLVLIALADQANDEGVTWPAMSTIERRTGLSLATVKRVLKDLREAGILDWTHRERDNGSTRSNRYQIDVARVAQMARTVRGGHGEPGGGHGEPLGAHDGPRGGVMVSPLEPPEEPSEEPNHGDRIDSESGFAEFYRAYPRKMKPADSFKAYRQVDGPKHHAAIMKGVADWVANWEATGTLTKFIPYPATFLRSEQWRSPPDVEKVETVGDGVPESNHDLIPWAKSKGYGEPRTGETWDEYRRRLTGLHRQRKAS